MMALPGKKVVFGLYISLNVLRKGGGWLQSRGNLDKSETLYFDEQHTPP